MSRRPFTVNQANAMVPSLEEIFARLDTYREIWTGHDERLQILDALWGEAVVAVTNPDHEEFIEERAALKEASRKIDDAVHRDLIQQGLRLPSGGLEHGILDFPTTWEGRWVYLCWHRGEVQISHWHEIDTGFAGRQELTEEQVIEMGRIEAIMPHESGLDLPPMP